MAIFSASISTSCTAAVPAMVPSARPSAFDIPPVHAASGKRCNEVYHAVLFCHSRLHMSLARETVQRVGTTRKKIAGRAFIPDFS
jgi:hypothetical protein